MHGELASLSVWCTEKVHNKYGTRLYTGLVFACKYGILISNSRNAASVDREVRTRVPEHAHAL